MPFIPFYLSYDPISSLSNYMVDREFGLGMDENDLLTPSFHGPMPREYYRPWKWNNNRMADHGSFVIKKDRNKFVINLDVQHFAPEEISVRTADDYVIIEGKHDEKKDHQGSISRHFIRRYDLPEGTNPELIESKLSSDGILSVIASKPTPEAKNERAVPIAQTGPVRKNLEDNSSTSSANGSEN